MRRTSTLVLLGFALTALACGPVWMFPGGRLDGEVADGLPSDWAIAEDVKNVQLETRPGAPYSVNVWGAGVGSHFYVASGRGDEATWARNIAADPEVRLRIRSTVYELRAVRVQDETERQRFLAAVKRKYDWEPDAEQQQKAVLFRLDPR